VRPVKVKVKVKVKERSGCRAPLVLNLETRRNSLVSITLQLLFPKINSPMCTLSSRLFGPWRWSGLFGEEKDVFPLPDLSPRSYGV